MTERRQRLIFVSVLICICVSMLVMNFVTPLESDDYSYMYSFQNSEPITTPADWLNSGKAHYAIMNGRIVTNILFAQGMALAGKTVFNFANTIVYMVFLYGLYLLIQNGKPWDWKRMLALHCAVFLGVPVFGATVLWMNGACNYLWGTTLILYTIVPFRNAILGGATKMKWSRQVGYGILALMAGNVTENTSFALLVFMGLCMLYLLAKKEKIPLWMIGLAGCVAAGYLVLMFSGQTIGRINQGSMGQYLKNFSDCMSKLLSYSWLLLLLAFLAVLAYRDHGLRSRLWLSAGLFISAMVANVMMTVPGYYAQRGAFGWVILLVVACGLLLPALRQIRTIPLWDMAVVGLAALFVVTYLWALPQCYDRYRMAQARVEDVIAQRENEVVDVVTFGIRSKTDYDAFCDGNTMSAASTYLPNRAFARKMGVNTVSLSQELY